jgi:phosphoserine phosphatase RsbU/P
MANPGDLLIHDQLLERRRRLESAVRDSSADYLTELLREVDAALERMDAGSYGICEVCHDTIEKDRLIADPLMRFCLDHLTPDQKGTLEDDLNLAATIQDALLPQRIISREGWSVAYHYEPAGPVSGDYCDVLDADGGGMLFLLGDISGKGVAASLLMSQIHAIFRTLLRTNVPLARAMEQANRIICESTMPGHYATLVCGRMTATGDIEICNAGHCPPIYVYGSSTSMIAATGVPIGLFCDGTYATTTLRMGRGDNLVLYTDGLSEAEDRHGNQYGEDRICALVLRKSAAAAEHVVHACVAEVRSFASQAPRKDDLTVMVIQRTV